jgi:hypothetical protein
MQNDLNKFTVEVHRALEDLEGKVILVCARKMELTIDP